MNFTVIDLHHQSLQNIIDAAIANKGQNRAVKAQVAVEINTLMNRLAEGWLQQKQPTLTNGTIGSVSDTVDATVLG
jgi:hypothetical protein